MNGHTREISKCFFWQWKKTYNICNSTPGFWSIVIVVFVFKKNLKRPLAYRKNWFKNCKNKYLWYLNGQSELFERSKKVWCIKSKTCTRRGFYRVSRQSRPRTISQSLPGLPRCLLPLPWENLRPILQRFNKYFLHIVRRLFNAIGRPWRILFMHVRAGKSPNVSCLETLRTLRKSFVNCTTCIRLVGEQPVESET